MNPNLYNTMLPIAPALTSTQASNTDDLHKKKRTRAKRSCDYCRKKKTRCDAVDNQPCTKCRLANIECLFLVEQKKRGPSTGSYVETLEARLIRMEKLIQDMTREKQAGEKEKRHEDHDLNDRAYSESPLMQCTGFPKEHDEESEEEDEVIVSRREEKGFQCPALLVAQAKRGDTIEEGLSKMTISDYQRTRYIGASSGVHFLGDKLLLNGKKHRIPHEPSWFVQKLNDDIDEHVIMKSKEIVPLQFSPTDGYAPNRIALFEDTPHLTQELADYLVDMYFTRVHLYCPIINKTQFLEEYYFHKPNRPDKYLLYAIVTIGTALFLPEVSVTHNFHFTKEELFELYTIMKGKTNKLLTILHKRSMISTVQSLMLLSMFVGHDDDDEEDTSHWFITGMAIRMAQDLGLHRDCSKWDIPDYEIELRKRIWYSAYMMDRWVAAELGRPVSILDHEFDVELPNPYELNTPPTQHSKYTPALIVETEASLAEKKPVYTCFLYMITLSQIAGQVLVGFHSTRAKKYRHDNIALLNILDRSLTNWKLSLPNELKWDVARDQPGVLNTTACILNMTCDCVWLLLYRPFIKTFAEEPENTAWAVKALSICTASSVNLVTTAERMDYQAFVALPWNMAVYAVFQAAIIFLHNAKGENDFIRDQGKSYLKRCARIYNRDPYLRTTRVVKVLQQYMANYEIYMDDDSSSNSSSNGLCSGPSTSASPSIGERRKRSEDVFDKPLIFLSQTAKQIEGSKKPDSVIAASVQPPPHVDNSAVTAKDPMDYTTHGVDMFTPFSTTLNPLNQDLYTSALRLGFHKSDLNGIIDIHEQQHSYEQPPQGQVSNDLVDPILCMDTSGGCPSNVCDTTQYADNTTATNNYSQVGINEMNYGDKPLQQQQQQGQQLFDVASLSSQIPIWDLPSGVTWNEWESFLKSNVQ